MSWNRALPYGTRDKLFDESRRMTEVSYAILSSFYQRGYQQIETPTFEYKEIFSNTLDERDPHLYQFFDKRGRTLALRPDMTLPIGRVVSTIGLEGPLKLTYSGKVFRVYDEFTGKNNEQMQSGIEIIGGDPLKAEVEAVASVIEMFKVLAITDVTIEIGHAAIYQSLTKELQLDAAAQQQLASLLESKSLSGMREFAKQYRAEEALLLQLPRLFGTPTTIKRAVALTTSPTIKAALQRMGQLIAQLEMMGYGRYLSVDLGMVQTFDYYTGVIFRGYTNTSAQEFLSGGRYDELFQRFGGEKRTAVGLGINLDEVVRLKQHEPVSPTNKMIRTLVHYDVYACEVAALTATPQTELSLCATLTESLTYAREHQFQRVLAYSETGIEVIEV
ncbi:ATP phosphoribosyltransferase regulatory subunit [Brochothrix campestris]|uniref:ATP phosphoribosyltransferase regulatory subunit n=1 Tax=Brochothrix campestris FSL F6-1037 TaxID=1265861 RepID=W7CJJ4_9LIST|nr:ATP phosphoribosyltransferase regulatory subunit [Brochothrix campestris]EUJ37000.1 ATP phosphoribosyltransferase regulatory subunit [Brochothrix campestris FSL F6-1037]